MNACMVLLLGVDGPVRLVTGEEGPARFPAWALVMVFGGVAALSLLTWGLVAYRARVAGNDREYAFRALARALKIPRASRALVRRLAMMHGSASPVALLLSEHALRSAIDGFEASQPAKRDARALEQLRRTLSV